MKMTRRAWRNLLRATQRQAKNGQYVTALSELYRALNREPGLRETKEAVDRLRTMKDLPVTEFFVYVQRKADNRRAIVSGPYPDFDTAHGRIQATTRACEDQVKDGHWLWFEGWGVAEAEVGALQSKLGVI